MKRFSTKMLFASAAVIGALAFSPMAKADDHHFNAGDVVNATLQVAGGVSQSAGAAASTVYGAADAAATNVVNAVVNDVTSPCGCVDNVVNLSGQLALHISQTAQATASTWSGNATAAATNAVNVVSNTIAIGH
jgi:hypothetical protein